MPYVVFFDDDANLTWPEDLQTAWPYVEESECLGECRAELVTDPGRLGPILCDKEAPPDAIFVDLFWEVSAEEGLPLVRKARELAPTLPIVILTNQNLTDKLVNECKQIGGITFWQKSSGSAELAAKLLEALQEISPLLKEARSFGAIHSLDERVALAIPWIERNLPQAPNLCLHEVMTWLRQALGAEVPLEERVCPLDSALNCVIKVADELERRNQAIDEYLEFRASALYHLARHEEAEKAYLKAIEKASTPRPWERLAHLAEAQDKEDRSRTYKLGMAKALLDSCEFGRAAKACQSLVSSKPGDEEARFMWIAAVQGDKGDIVPVLGDSVRYLASLRLNVDDWISKLEDLRARQVSVADLCRALQGMDAAEWLTRLQVRWAECLCYGESESEIPRILDVCDLTMLEKSEDLLVAADLMKYFSRTPECRDALRLAALAAAGEPNEEHVLRTCQQRSEKILDIEGMRTYQQQILRCLADHGGYQDVLREAESWMSSHPDDFDTSELAAGLLIRSSDLRYQRHGLQMYLKLLEAPSVRAQDASVIRLLHKVRPLSGLDERPQQIMQKIEEEWQGAGKVLGLSAQDKLLAGKRLLLIGGDALERRIPALKDVLGRNGAEVTPRLYQKQGGDERQSIDRLTKQIKAYHFCVVHLGMQHANSMKFWDAFRLLSSKGEAPPHVFVAPSCGEAGILNAIENKFGPLER